MRVLYIDCDTLRPDHLGCYGYHRNTSPTIDRVAAEGVRFTNYYASDAPCLPSRAALMTGAFGIHSGVINHGGQQADLRLQGAGRGFRDHTNWNNLPWIFRRYGMHTAAISTFNERHSAWWFDSGYNEFHNVGGGGSESAEEVTPVALDWVERKAADDDWFLWLHYWDPHTSYRAPDDFGNPFANDPIPDWITPEILEQHQQCVGPHCAQEINMYDDQELPDHPSRHVPAVRNMDDLKRHFDGYDTGIRYMDHHIGTVLDALDKQGVLDDTWIVISADHGENQGELGIYAEHGTADHPTCRIPMIVRPPTNLQGFQRGHADEGLHYNLDFNPTMADLMAQLNGGDSMRGTLWDGQSYISSLTDGSDTGRDQLVVSQCAHHCQRGVRWGDWLYIRTWHDGFHLFPEEMLFNIAEDPHEQHDLASERPDLCAEGARRYLDWHSQMMATMPEGYHDDPMWRVIAEGGPEHAHRTKLAQHDYLGHLQRTGRAWAIPELKKRHPECFDADGNPVTR